AVAGQRSLRGNCSEKARAIRRANLEKLGAHAQRNLQTIGKHKNLILSKDGQRSLAIRRVVNRAERWHRRLKYRFVLVFETGSREIVTTKPQVRACIERVGLAVVDAEELKITEWIKRGKLWIDARSIKVSPRRGNMLVGDGVGDLVIDLMSQSC